MAVNCSLYVLGTEGFTGVMVIELRVAAVTVNVVEPECPLKVAEIVVPPVATAVALPCEPEVLEMVATEVADELQVTWVVMSWTVLSL